MLIDGWQTGHHCTYLMQWISTHMLLLTKRAEIIIVPKALFMICLYSVGFKRNTLLVLACFISFSVYSQEVRNRKFALTLSPAILTFDKFGLQMGLEFFVGKRFSVTGEVAFPLSTANRSYEHIQLLRIGLEGKGYLWQFNKAQLYLSLQVSYFKRVLIDTGRSDFYYNRRNGVDDGASYHNATIQSPVYSLASKYGVEVLLSNRIILDGFVGSGLRIIQTKYYSKQQFVPFRSIRNQESLVIITPSYEYNKTLYRLHIPTGFRITYAF